ncbi:MAG: radical SAM protein [Candidatus Aenigmarchaeota archaeon]|nr:radical SAM protein [Candidatus Aenigmarchaeota archaeon]
MKTVYGPVPSWRLRRSLGIDVIAREKTCSFDCVYCQLGRTKNKTSKLQEFISVKRLEKDLSEVINKVKVDYITFSGMGEPTLASNLGQAIDVIRGLGNIPIAILTNSSLFSRKEVKKNLSKLDFIVAKLDVPNERLLREINRPVEGITFDRILDGIKTVRKEFNEKFALQIMFIDKNKGYASDLANLAREIRPDEVQIDTPLRYSPIKPLNSGEIRKIKSEFEGLNVITVYEAERPKVEVLDVDEYLRRRPEPWKK